MRDIVIPVAVERHNLHVDLVLASIARLHPGRRVVLIGELPRLAPVDLDILHIPTVQRRGAENVFRNTDLAMRVACEDDRVSPVFIWTADDIYWVRHAEPVRWAIGKLQDAAGSSVYSRRKHTTAALLHDLGFPTWDYEAHTPMLIRKAPMLEALAVGGEKRSVYGNITGTPDTVAPDVKLRHPSDPMPDAAWVSTELALGRYPALHALLRAS